MFRIYNHELQNLFGDFFTVNRELHGHNTRQALHYHIPLFKTNLGKSFMRYYGAMIWNNVSENSNYYQWISLFQNFES